MLNHKILLLLILCLHFFLLFEKHPEFFRIDYFSLFLYAVLMFEKFKFLRNATKMIQMPNVSQRYQSIALVRSCLVYQSRPTKNCWNYINLMSTSTQMIVAVTHAGSNDNNACVPPTEFEKKTRFNIKWVKLEQHIHNMR